MSVIASSLPDRSLRPDVPALSVEGLCVEIDGMRAVDDLSFSIARGRTLCLVGESGCGKTLTCLALAAQLPPNARVVSGVIDTGPRTGGSAAPRIAVIYQDATASLNPVIPIGTQISEVLRVHAGLSQAAARSEVLRLLDQVGIPDARRRYQAFPHELSGGMNQRVAIARALACRSDILLADEPTTALDVTVQAQILDLLREIQAEIGLALLFVTHDLGVVAEIATDMAVMYAGHIVEQGPVEILFHQPAHPYTSALLACRPTLSGSTGRLAAIPGTVPPLSNRPASCGFAPRCQRAGSPCLENPPPRRALVSGAKVRCYFPNIEEAP